MESSFLTQIMLPLTLAMIMFGMGLSLTKEDFVRLWRLPKPVFVGLFGQLVLMPAIAYSVAIIFDLSAPLAIGLMILAACPGGTMSNVISLLARANLALSVTLTAFATVICVFSTPFIIQFAISQFSANEPVAFSLANTTVGLFFITLVPVLIGLICRQKFPNAAMRWEPKFQRFSGIFILCMIVAILIQERDVLVTSFSQVFWATLALNLLSVGAGLFLAKVFKLRNIDGVTLGIEVGIQNASMAMLIAITFLEKSEYATSAGVYGLTMYIGAALLIVLARRIHRSNAQNSIQTANT